MVGKGTRKWFMWEVVVGDCYSYELPLWWTPTPFQFLEKAPNCNKKSGIWLLIYGWHAHVGGWDFFVLFLFLLEFNKTRDKIAQARTHTQRHMNNALSGMVILTPCLALYCLFSTWYSQTIWDNSSPTTDQPCRFITNLFLYEPKLMFSYWFRLSYN